MGIMVLSACEKEDPPPTGSIVEIAQAEPDLSSLVAGLTKFPYLVTTLSGMGELS